MMKRTALALALALTPVATAAQDGAEMPFEVLFSGEDWSATVLDDGTDSALCTARTSGDRQDWFSVNATADTPDFFIFGDSRLEDTASAEPRQVIGRFGGGSDFSLPGTMSGTTVFFLLPDDPDAAALFTRQLVNATGITIARLGDEPSFFTTRDMSDALMAWDACRKRF